MCVNQHQKTMNIIKSGELYRLFDDGIEVGRQLAADYYEVIFIPNEGFFLRRVKMPDPSGIKCYGRMSERIEKVLRSYAAADKNLGVILSGAKGIGKSLFAKKISRRAVEAGLPVVMVNEYIKGLPQFLSSIDQRCMVLFDEFDKNFFDASSETDDHTAVQDAFLTLFDGVYSSNKLFVITANSLNKLSQFLVNRPGRFRYHIRFSYPEEAEIREFLEDQLTLASAKGEIDDVVKFSTIVPLSYDCLTAIATELNLGEKFEESLEVLNIINVTGEHYYHGLVRFESGEELRTGWVGSRNFFDKTADSSYLSVEVSMFKGLSYDGVGSIVIRQGDVRKKGHFMQDGSIVVSYEDGTNFRWVPYQAKGRGRQKTVEKAPKLGKPTELILMAEGASTQVSFKELV